MFKKIKEWVSNIFSERETMNIDPDGYEIPPGYLAVDGKRINDLTFNLNENDNIHHNDKDFDPEAEGFHEEKIEFNGFRLGNRRIGFKPEERNNES